MCLAASTAAIGSRTDLTSSPSTTDQPSGGPARGPVDADRPVEVAVVHHHVRPFPGRARLGVVALRLDVPLLVRVLRIAR